MAVRTRDQAEIDGNDPRQYEQLTEEKRAALREWLRWAVRPAARASRRTTYGIKHDFERDGFYVSNGAFKGALLEAGYEISEQNKAANNWRFRIQPTCPARCVPNGLIGRGWYGLWHLAPAERAEFETYLRAAMESGNANG